MNDIEVYLPAGGTITVPRDRIRWVQRSAAVALEKCPQLEFFQYRWGPEGRGVAPSRTFDHFELGSAVHEGLQALMEGAADPETRAASYFLAQHGRLQMANHVDLHTIHPEMYQTMFLEQQWLAMGLVWAFERRIWPGFREQYEVVSLEEEINWLVGTVGDWHYVMMTRVDGVVRSRGTGQYFVLSHKTAKKFYSNTAQGLELDVQHQTEGMAVRAKYGVEPAGTIYFYFIKGERKADEFGYKRHESVLVRPFMMDSTAGGAHDPRHFAAVGKWYKTLDRPGGQLGPGWSRCDLWEEMDPREYWEWLDQGQIQSGLGRDWLGEVVVTPITEPWLLSRAQGKIEQILYAQDRLYREIEQGAPVMQYTHNCFSYHTRCSFYDQCWNGSRIETGLTIGRWVPRTANHAIEFQTEEEGE